MLRDSPAFDDYEALFFDPSRHRDALARLASAALSAQRASRALPFADRRCRLPAPGARDFLLRAAVSRALGRLTEADQDLERAYAIDPNDEGVQACALKWGSPAMREAAAAGVIAGERDDGAGLVAALAALRSAGRAFACRLLERQGGWTGWVAWDEARTLELEFGPDRLADRHPAEPDLAHRLGGAGWLAAEVSIEFAADVTFLLEGEVVRRIVKAPAARHVGAPRRRLAPQGGAPMTGVSVIVPVYENFEMTKACLDALNAEGSSVRRRIVVVDDATPNAAIRALLEERAAQGQLEHLRNESNLGFAASVNRALALCDSGDVILLNADAVLPPGAIARLAAAAATSPDIGTLTPFANNGEFTSFPEPNVVNPLPDADELRALAEAAFAANGAATVDLPNGVGFCLYVTRACLDKVGPLPELYARGYYEDVEFCLRAREAGFRNVCATGVYVGHAGARSFRGDKRALVTRNLAILEKRFPEHASECAAFLHADPLAHARGRIERRLRARGQVTLLVAPEGEALRLAEERARTIERLGLGETALICACARQGDKVRMIGAAGAPPRSLAFSLAEQSGVEALGAYCQAQSPQAIELFAPLELPERALAALSGLSAPRRLVVGDLRWFGAPALELEKRCPNRRDPGGCESCAVPTVDDADRRAQAQRLGAIMADCSSLIALDRLGLAFARAHLSQWPLASAESGDEAGELPPAAASLADGAVVGVWSPHPAGEADRLLTCLARHLQRRGRGSLAVLGRCVDDLSAMAAGNVFVSGPVANDEAAELLSQYGVGKLLSPYRTHGYGPLDALARRTGSPMAYFDWSFGELPVEPGDLALDPRRCDERAARSIADWLLESGEAGERQ